jgi:hypothetical protein
MPLLVEKRREGHDRRSNAGRSSFAGRERRVGDRRQLVVKEIPFREWALHLIHFQKRLEMRRKRALERDGHSTPIQIDLGDLNLESDKEL